MYIPKGESQTTNGDSKMYEVWKINERGTYELVTTTFEPKLAGKIRKKLMDRGIFAQVCERGKNKIINH